jgi:hypothetical protein
MGIWDFFDKHDFIAFVGLCCVYYLIVRLIRLPTLLVHGWPPHSEHHACDADGDWHRKQDKGEE